MSTIVSDPPAYANVPQALKLLPQFVVWKLEFRDGNPKATKVPYNPITGNRADTTDPTTWSTYEHTVLAMQHGGYSGIGFVITKNDPFVFLDFDDCRDEAGNWINETTQWGRFPGTAWEYSQSGNGLHLIATITDKRLLENHVNKWRRPDGGMNECYTHSRFIAFGPHGWQNEPRGADVMLQLFVPLRSAATSDLIEWADTPQPDYEGPDDDEALIEKMLCARGGPSAMFGRSPSFKSLWEADAIELGHFMPDKGGKSRPFDHSSADMALMNALAWWTGCNHARMWRLFQKSALFRPEKHRTAVRALHKAASEHAASGSYMKSRAARMKDAAEIGEGLAAYLITPVMTLDEMRKQLVFVRSGNAVAHCGIKRVQRIETARTDYAASKYEVDTGKVDKEGRPVIRMKPVFDAWRDGHKLTVDQITWQPGQDEFCTPLEETGMAFNTYQQLQLTPPPGNWHEWIKPFDALLAFLIPVAEERQGFIQWLAHIVQKPEVLPHTCYLFFTSAHGTGRGTLAEILARVFAGNAAIGTSPSEVINDGFNGRQSRKLLATVDEVREGTRSASSREAQRFKSRINEPHRHINPKYGVQSVEKNCCRWLFFSQYADALPFDNKDRRVIVIANPTEPQPPEWYIGIRQFMQGDDAERQFIASIQHYLSIYDLTGFNPGAHAPMNDAKRTALSLMESSALRAAKLFAQQWPVGLALAMRAPHMDEAHY
ncbi:MAG: DUF5906 domain-containing protein [Sphingobium sp.]|jgi:primase-polymerase (primpol)-like protein|nr:DUF5906 domain-containing protein [Sphingobium sp.]MCI1270400.1 DUF5906 domain-containing protein [Sphingobium sp.]MCI1755568.1 DUF5906 domain-containing protein [Sphingobium sp.]MCI2052943.1 DUF5906 domain-containing protein [Sphingobium sp.]